MIILSVSNLKKRISKSISKQSFMAYTFVIPAALLLFVFLVVPAIMALAFSFTDFYILRPEGISFIGIKNYVTLFQDELFLKCLWNTSYFVFVLVPIEGIIALGLAILVNKNIIGKTFFRTSYFAPVITSIAVVAILWSFIYNPNDGLINAALNALGIPSQMFLRSASQAMNSIIFMTIWQGVGIQMIIFLAGLKQIPTELYEASAIDGATAIQQFFKITIPGLKNVISFIVIWITIQAFKLFTQPYIMTYGGPENSTRTLVYYIYQQGFQYKKAGYASCMAMVFFVIVVCVAMVQKRILIKKE
ncbi:sn-glycerol-3-phosphate transport system permease protein UgpA [subsurface metagenome]